MMGPDWEDPVVFRLHRTLLPLDQGTWIVEVPFQGPETWEVVGVIYSGKTGPRPEGVLLELFKPVPLAMVAGILEMMERILDGDSSPPSSDPSMN